MILQHPRERDMPIGTARMAKLCLPQSELHVGIRWGESAAFAKAISDPTRPAILLSPGPTAKDILREPPEGPVTLVVVDGTWSQAKVVVRDNPALQALPRYAFSTPEPSQYRIRKEPRAEYVSTIEALMHVLGVLEGDPARFRALLDPLNAMVDAQLAAQQASPRRSTPRQPKPPSKRRLPDAFVHRYEDVVCVVGEANAWPYEAGVRQGPDELVHFVAHRLATGESFEAIARPEHGVSTSTPFHLGLPAKTFEAGMSRAELVSRYAAFSRPTDIACGWGTYGMSLLADALPADRIDMREAAQRLLHKKFGTLEGLVATLGPLPISDKPGRANARLASLVALARAWKP